MTWDDALLGGNNAGDVARVGTTVRRRPTPNSRFVTSLLSHLRDVGFTGAPRCLGVDAQGRDIFTFIPGETTNHPSQRDEAAYGAGGSLLRALHDATSGHSLAGSRQCVIHGDPGPFNAVFRDGMPVAFIDWDSAKPGARMWDLSYMAWTWCIQSAGDVPVEDQARRLRELRDAYGIGEAEMLLRGILKRQRYIARVSELLLLRPEGARSHREHQLRAITWATDDREHVERHADLFLRALR